MNNYPGFNEFLLDRTTEKTKETKESKFAIIKTIAESPTAVDIFGQPYIVQVKALALQGPFFVQTQSEVAFEGEWTYIFISVYALVYKSSVTYGK